MTKRPSSELRLLLVVPYVQTEVLAVVGRRSSRGLAYDPLSTRDPVPWSRDCPECRAGRIKAPLKVRRAIQSLCTARLTSPSTYATRLETGKTLGPRYDVQVVVGKNARCHLSAAYVKNGDWVVSVKTRNQDFRSPVVRRTMQMLSRAYEVATTNVCRPWSHFTPIIPRAAQQFPRQRQSLGKAVYD